MVSIMEATPSQFEAARAHKARLARIAGRAIMPKTVQPMAVVICEPEPVVALAPVEPEPTPLHAFHVPWNEDRVITVDMIKATVCREFGVTKVEIEAARRTIKIVRPRQVAMYLARELTTRSLPDIARRFGRRDHTTAIHSANKISQLMAADPVFAARVNAIRESLVA
jgi:hypothetical protein